MLFRKFGAALAAIALGLASGQAAHAEGRRYDASQMPLQMAAGCYALFLVIGEDHRNEIFIVEDDHKAMLSALQQYIEAQMRASGRPADFFTEIRPVVEQTRQQFDVVAAFDLRDRCEVAADAGMVKLRSTPATQDALNCLAVMANTTPSDPKTAFLQIDMAVALKTFDVSYMVRDEVFSQVKADAAAALAGPQGAAIKQQFAGCEAKVRPALRKAAYVGKRWGVYEDGYSPLKYIRADLKAGLGGPVPAYVDDELWNMSEASWDKWVASPEAGDAAICVGEYPYRDKGKPANDWTNMDIAVKVMEGLGVSRDEAYVVLASGAWKIDDDVNRFAMKAGPACEAWGKAMAAKFGGTYYKAKMPAF